MSLGSDFVTVGTLAFGSQPFFFGFAAICFAIILFVTRQSATTSIVLGMVFIDGLTRISGDDRLNFIFLALKIITLAIIGYSVARHATE